VWDLSSSRAFGTQCPRSKSSIISFSQFSDARYVARSIEDFRSRTNKLPLPAELSRPPISLRSAFSVEIQRHDTLFDLIDMCSPVFLDINFCSSIDYSRGDIRFSGINIEVENAMASRLYLQRLFLESLFS
jgi:hypothetical protein